MSKLNKLLIDLSNHSVAALPMEACGIITKDFDYVPCRNVSNTPTINFIIDPIEVYKYENNIWGFFHSHPNSGDPIPSKKDLPSKLFNSIKFIVGFGNKFYIYWNDNDNLRFEIFDETYDKI